MNVWDNDRHTWVVSDSPPVYDLPDARAARWVLRLLATSIFVAVVAVVFVVTVAVSRDDQRNPTLEPVAPDTNGVASVGLGAGLGPSPGAVVDDYVSTRRRDLAEAVDDGKERTAVISLLRYSSEAEARRVVGALAVEALVVTPPGGPPQVVTQTMTAWSEEQRKADVELRDEIRSLIPTAGNDPEFLAFYKKEVIRLDRAIANASPTSPVVFALVVNATLPQLKTLSERGDVRLVDIGPLATGPELPQVRGLRPEESARAGEPSVRPVDDA